MPRREQHTYGLPVARQERDSAAPGSGPADEDEQQRDHQGAHLAHERLDRNRGQAHGRGHERKTRYERPHVTRRDRTQERASGHTGDHCDDRRESQGDTDSTRCRGSCVEEYNMEAIM